MGVGVMHIAKKCRRVLVSDLLLLFFLNDDVMRNISAAAVVASPPQQQQPPRPVAAAAAALLLQGGLICNFRTQDLGWKWIHGLCQKNKALFFAQKEWVGGFF